MPAHPTSACYCHVIDVGHTNIARLLAAEDTQAAAHELNHVRSVAKILTDFLLYSPKDARWSDSEHDRYWDSIRPTYIQSAAPESILTYYDAWEFLAMATRFDFRADLVEEARRLRLAFHGE
jgi:hypothetical protein